MTHRSFITASLLLLSFAFVAAPASAQSRGRVAPRGGTAAGRAVPRVGPAPRTVRPVSRPFVYTSRPYVYTSRPAIRLGIYAGYGYPYGYYGYPFGYSYYGYPAYGYPGYAYGSAYGYPGSAYGYPGSYGYPGYSSSRYGWGGVRIHGAPQDAEVFADGYYVGVVDDFDGVLQQLNLEAGPHHIEIRVPNGPSLAFDVNVVPGQTITYRAAQH